MADQPLPHPDADHPVPDYPAHWEADVVLRDGGTAHIRPITPQDGSRLVEFHSRLSEETIYFRFFAPYPRLTERDVRRFTSVDHHDRVALVALVAGKIIGVARYDRIGDGEAEVAFNVEDAHQGRGLGSILLEHLAEAARENAVQRFVADVLPTNRRMVGVFKEAGYTVHHEYADGVLRLEFPIAATEASRAVAAAREHRAESRSVDRLLRPGSVVVVGAGSASGSVGRALLDNLVAAGFVGPLAAVNEPVGPVGSTIAGVPAYPALGAVPFAPGLVVVAVPADRVAAVVAEAAALGVHGLLVATGGFAEAGVDGGARQHRLVADARASGMRVVGPNSFGLINTDPQVRMNASLAPRLPTRGRIGFFCQSGALGVAILEAASRRGMGVSSFVSAGNRADVSGNDLLQYWEEDPDTDVVLLYLESIGNPRKFSRIARRLGRHTPVVAVKSGRSTQGVPLGHTVRASSVPPAAVEAMFAQAGVIGVDSIHELLDVGQLLTGQPLPAGPRVAVVGNSGALGLLAADAVATHGLTLVGQPVALGAAAGGTEFARALAAVVADPVVDSVVVVAVPPIGEPDEAVVEAIADAGGRGTVTVVASVLGTRTLPGPAAHGRQVPSYPTPEDTVRALAAVTRYAAWRARPVSPPVDPAGVDVSGARQIIDQALVGQGFSAPVPVAADTGGLVGLLGAYGITVLTETPICSAEEAERAASGCGYPVALKAMAGPLRHRTDLGGVRLGLDSAAAVRGAYAEMIERLGPDQAGLLVVQPMAPPGVAVVVSTREDPLFGPIVSFGLSGVATDLLADRSYRIPPLTGEDVRAMIGEPKASPMLFGHRGAEPVDVEALADLVARVARLADDLPEVAALDLDPVIVAAHGLTVVHAEGQLAARELERPDSGPRRLRRA